MLRRDTFSTVRSNSSICGRIASVLWGLFSTVGDNISTVGDSFSTMKCIQYIEG